MSNGNGPTPLGALFKGALAGAVGTLVMDLVWYARFRRDGGEESFLAWEFSSDTESYEDAGTPAQVGKRIVEGVFRIELDPATAGPMNNLVHWATGIGWGQLHGVVAGSIAGSNPLLGLVTGTTAFLAGYTFLAPAGLYKPIWEYDAETLWKDWSAHFAYGMATGITFSMLGGE